ncbi:MAG: TldD/PmbA family protein [Candidatus Eremiobacteraeota bacterium]|nr:TldD/PmbA family protein [Candidatus Eremiobacteraeota bacterium]
MWAAQTLIDPIEFVTHVVKRALKAGATQAEAALTISQRFNVEARGQTITKLEQSTGNSLALRVFVDERKATLHTSDFQSQSLEDSIIRLLAGAAYVGPDRYARLPDSLQPATDVDLHIFAADVVERDAKIKIREAQELEAATRACDARIDNSNGARCADAVVTSALANSLGFAGSYRGTRVSRGVSPVASDGNSKRTASYGTAGRSLCAMESVQTVAETAARRTVELFGARKPQTMRVPVIFERDVAAAVLTDIFSALSGANVAVGNSFLGGKIGGRIGSDVVTIVDDGRLSGGMGTVPYDGEGVATRRTVHLERGFLRSYALDTYYGRKLALPSTGNSVGGGIGPNNFYLQAGRSTLEELVASTPRGVLVMDTIGFATEYASGTYSRGARGFAIEDGELAYPIEEFTIAGTFPAMLDGIDAVANDLRFDSTVVSPSFRVAEMTVSGN